MMDECNIGQVVGGGRIRPEGDDKETMRAESPAKKNNKDQIKTINTTNIIVLKGGAALVSRKLIR